MLSYSVGISAGNSNQTWVPFHSSVGAALHWSRSLHHSAVVWQFSRLWFPCLDGHRSANCKYHMGNNESSLRRKRWLPALTSSAILLLPPLLLSLVLRAPVSRLALRGDSQSLLYLRMARGQDRGEPTLNRNKMEQQRPHSPPEFLGA